MVGIYKINNSTTAQSSKKRHFRKMGGIMGNEVSTCQMQHDDLKPQKEEHRI
jgi:hypothetical protein